MAKFSEITVFVEEFGKNFLFMSESDWDCVKYRADQLTVSFCTARIVTLGERICFPRMNKKLIVFW